MLLFFVAITKYHLMTLQQDQYEKRTKQTVKMKKKTYTKLDSKSWMNFFGFEQKFSKPKIFPQKSLGTAFYLDLKKDKIIIFQNFAKIPREKQVGEKIEKKIFFFKVLHLLYTPHKYRRHWLKRH